LPAGGDKQNAMSEHSNDPFDLQRFVEAQKAIYPQALAELRAGHKQSHWSWFIFPQVVGLGSSSMSVRYAIKSLAEAQAYLAHPVLGARLSECVSTLNSLTVLSADQILGAVDAQKYRSCLTLFARAGIADPAFGKALTKYFDGKPDDATLAILAKQQGAP
jgi:uncharacterized protein (DUF1810 family)